jgi:mRNA interferase HicA
MKRSELIRHLKNQGCELLREGGRHSIWKNPASGKMTAIPRHNEIKNFMAWKICRDLDIPKP